jgi:hypothetical protein
MDFFSVLLKVLKSGPNKNDQCAVKSVQLVTLQPLQALERQDVKSGSRKRNNLVSITPDGDTPRFYTNF